MARRVVLFYRDFQRFTGGHLKVWDYFNHVAAAPDTEPRIAFSSRSVWDSTNPWLNRKDAVVEWNPETADMLFLGGTDWQALPASQRKSFSKPIINLIQHPRHAEPGSELRSFLSHRAIRICVSEEVASAIRATNEVNGPVHVIPNGVDGSCFPARPKSISERTTDLLICGLKAPELARDCYRHLSGGHGVVRWMIDWAPREEFLRRMADAKVVLLLPRHEEGFYLPALEAMGSGSVVVCPDCLGNRSFCLDGVNSFRPAYDFHQIIAATEQALRLARPIQEQLLESARSTVSGHSLENERAKFLPILAGAAERH
jgi:glycosyltransferase involved in cell wall biosynthesis